jgi:hypothetical protein
MRTAIFVYQSTTVAIETHESNLQLVHLGTNNITNLPLSGGQLLGPGIYKILSLVPVTIPNSNTAFDAAFTSDDKTQWPEPPLRALSTFDLNTSEIQSFFVVPDAKSLARA